METRILGTTEADIRLAAEMIQKGGLVAFPTETVYGLGADALNAEAVGKVYAAKGRPSDNPMIVHIAQKSDMNKLTDGITPEVERLMEAFWPGPLTMVVPAKDVIPKVTTGGLATVGVRMPEDAIARALISAAGVPIAAPSANLSGKPSPTRYTHVAEDLDGRIDAIIAGDDCKAGIESTVVDMTGEVPTILRPGVITREMLREALNGEVAVDPALFEKPDIFNNDGNGLLQTGEDFHPKAPGMKYKHYAPKAKAIIFSGAPEHVVAAICKRYDEQTAKGERVAILGLDEHHYGSRTFLSLGSEKRPQEAAARLFAALRELDERGDTVALCEAVDTAGIGLAVMNRMGRAAAFDIEQV